MKVTQNLKQKCDVNNSKSMQCKWHTICAVASLHKYQKQCLIIDACLIIKYLSVDNSPKIHSEIFSNLQRWARTKHNIWIGTRSKLHLNLYRSDSTAPITIIFSNNKIWNLIKFCKSYCNGLPTLVKISSIMSGCYVSIAENHTFLINYSCIGPLFIYNFPAMRTQC